MIPRYPENCLVSFVCSWSMDIHGILWVSNGLKGAISLAEEVNGAIMSYLLRPLFVQPLLGWMHLSSGLSCPKSIQRTSKNCNVKTCQDSVRQYSSCACDAASTQISHMYIMIIMCVCTKFYSSLHLFTEAAITIWQPHNLYFFLTGQNRAC